MAESEKNCLVEQGKAKAGVQTVSLEEKERRLAEARDFLDQLAQGEGSVRGDSDWSFRNFSFGLGIDPNG